MVPNRLSEVELLKCLGAFQWDSIAQRLGQRSSEIVNGQRERLYASFVNVELAFPPQRSIDSFEEGSRVSLRNRVSVFARRFVEGMFVFDTAPVPAAETKAVATRAGPGAVWSSLGVHGQRVRGPRRLEQPAPGVRAVGHGRGRVHEPPDAALRHRRSPGRPGEGLRGLDGRRPRRHPRRRLGAAARVPHPAGERPERGRPSLLRPVRGHRELRRAPVPDRAARATGVVSRSSRASPSSGSTPTTSRTRTRSTRCAIFVTASLDPAPEEAPALDASGSRLVGRFRFDVDLYRASDGQLMASCRLQKALNVPDREKGLVYEGERLLALLRGRA